MREAIGIEDRGVKKKIFYRTGRKIISNRIPSSTTEAYGEETDKTHTCVPHIVFRKVLQKTSSNFLQGNYQLSKQNLWWKIDKVVINKGVVIKAYCLCFHNFLVAPQKDGD